MIDRRDKGIILSLMAAISFTPQQRQAIETVGRSIIVSAAAGSGKTAVLAERCAYLVCDAPPEHRCGVDELLVLTFTDAAAAEMRSRIVETLRARSHARPGDGRLREQVSLVAAAQISTIHSFCLWLVRRWFSELGIDPAATLLDADEATLVKREVLDGLFARLYKQNSTTEDPSAVLGSPLADEADARRDEGDAAVSEPDGIGRQTDEALGRAFVKLVDDYGLASDREIAALVLRLFEFVMSLPEPEGWLAEVRESPGGSPERIVLAHLADLRTELPRQIEHCEQAAAAIEAGASAGHFYASQIREYAAHVREWSAGLPPVAEPNTNQADPRDALAPFEPVLERIASFEFSRKTGPRLGKDTDPVVLAARDAAREGLRHVKERLFRDRLEKRFGLFSIDEWISGLRATAPYVSTVVDLVLAFHDAYASQKRRLDALDFSDLERLAFDLLHEADDPTRPSDVARSLHRRFAHVLVDEFQDINPVQQAIIRLASRESDPDRVNNLFVVGDVKQSIYRFRLAEPAIFAGRLSEFRSAETADLAISLQANFRSRAEILEGVNVLFRRLMREGVGEVVYDQEAELREGRHVDPNMNRHPVEVHLLERSWGRVEEADEDEPVEPGLPDLCHPARWTPIEREAYLIGSRIRQWMGHDGFVIGDEPLQYRDVAVLLRAARVNAERMAAMLASIGIPAYADAGGSLFAAVEIRDVLAALHVLDNPQQDIPLAAVLRSGIFGEPLSEDDLVHVGCHNRDIPFHEAVLTYAGRDDVHERLRAVLNRIGRYRREVRRRPLAEVLWSLYERQGYLAYVGGLVHGPQRRANLLKLHELARRFGTFRRQGLHRFLRFVESFEDKEQNIAAAPAIGESDDVVRIMSIHQAKGLEFPIVFVAGLGTKFNLGDRSGSMIFERKAGLGLRAVDTDRMIEYPSAAHARVAGEIERSAREEELRILYVAMTRAREKLVLVGTERNVSKCHDAGRNSGSTSSPSLLSITTAVMPLDWLIPALAAAPAGVVRGLGLCEASMSGWHGQAERRHDVAETGRRPPAASLGMAPLTRDSGVDGAPGRPVCDEAIFDVQVHRQEDMTAWSIPGPVDSRGAGTLQAVARGGGLPPDEPFAPNDPDVEQVLSRIEYVYPRLAVVSVRAALGASEVKRRYDLRQDADEREDPIGWDVPPQSAIRNPQSAIRNPQSPIGTAAHRGILTHRVLQHLDFVAAVDAAGVASELQRLTSEGLISADDCDAVDAACLEWFVSTPLAGRIRDAGGAYHREFHYIATEPPSYLDPSIGPTPGDQVLVRGIVDGILPGGDGLEIVDFKTDAVRPGDVDERAERYRPQMALYARAMSRLWRRSVCACRLVFLAARRVVELRDVG